MGRVSYFKTFTIFFHYNQVKVKIKMINHKNQFNIRQKKVLSLTNTLSRFSKLSKQFQEKNTLLTNCNDQRKNSLFKQVQIQQKQQFHSKGKMERKYSYDFPQNQIVSKSLDVKNSKKVSMFNNKTYQKQNKSTTGPFQKNTDVNKQVKKFPLNQNNDLQKTHVKIIQLLKFVKNKQISIQKQQQTKIINLNFQVKKHQKFQKRRLSLVKSSHNSYEKSSYQKLKIIPNIEDHIQYLQTNKDQYANSSNNHQQKIFPKCKFTICSNVIVFQKYQIIQKTSVEVQTFLTEPQFFEYLAYKRKKQEYQKELLNLFQQIQLVKQDRSQCYKRSLQFQKNCQNFPVNDRQKRIFHLKQQINECQNLLLNQINKKYKAENKILQEIQHIKILTSNGIDELGNMLKNYFKIFKKAFQKHSQTKYARIALRLQTLTSSFFVDLQKKILYQIDQNKAYKHDTLELRDSFNDYTKAREEHNVLLRNCFYQIKQLPQVFYKLFGNQLQELKLIKHLANQRKEGLMLKQKPKCLKCFNVEWKSYMIIQKNIAIQSVLKVAQQLVK